MLQHVVIERRDETGSILYCMEQVFDSIQIQEMLAVVQTSNIAWGYERMQLHIMD